MADEYLISAANLINIERALQSVQKDIGTLDNHVTVVNDNVLQVNNNVEYVNREVKALAEEFHEFVDVQMKANAKADSQRRLIELRQEVEKKFGHYDSVRRNATGILQADDLGIVRAETITRSAEELMLSAPRYWLAPCLVALAAWINDQKELADRAVMEALRRNDEKTSLFFALICRRADRKPSALKWTQRYLANQQADNLDRKTVIILDAFASGLLGADSEGVVAKQMGAWMDHLSAQPGFVERQTDQWSAAITAKKKPYNSEHYPQLKKYSPTWPALQDVMEGAMLHASILDYFTTIFEQEASSESLKAQLDEILDSLVTDFDDEELPYMKEQKYHQMVVDFEGDVERAKQNMAVEESAFEEHKDFTQLLTDAAMKPDSSHANVSTQKFAIALSKDWISNAYNDVVAQNRKKVPYNITFNLQGFEGSTVNGDNEEESISNYGAFIAQSRDNALAPVKLSGFEQFCLYGGIGITVLGIVLAFFGGFATFLGAVVAIAGIGMMINHFSKKKKVNAKRQLLESQFNEMYNNGCLIIRAIMAEVVDFRREFAMNDGVSAQVNSFLDEISPDQYVRKLSDSTRRINVTR